MSETTTTAPDVEQPVEPEAPAAEEQPDEPLGEKGLKALKAEQARRKDEADKRRAVEAELAELKKAGADPETRARLEAQEAATARANERFVRAEIKAAAKGKLADPADAFQFLDLSAFEVGDDGEVDGDAISTAIDDLLKRKPYLAAAQSTTPPPINQGVRKAPTEPTLAEQISAAEKAGDWKLSRRLKSAQLYQQTSK